MPKTPQEIRDLREATARSAVTRLKTLASECRKLSMRSAQTYETLAGNPKLQTLEAQLEEAKQHVDVIQAQLKSVTPVERMKRFAEQHTTQQEVHMLQSKVMDISQRLQPLQEKACQLFTKHESQGAELEQVSITIEQCLEGPLNDIVIREFTEQDIVALQQVEVARTKLEAFEEELIRPE
jgi:chromosome segregation ATPase